MIEMVRAIEQIKGKPVRLIIGDTLARMSAGANENSGEDMGPVMARFDQVATATVIRQPAVKLLADPTLHLPNHAMIAVLHRSCGSKMGWV